VSSLPVLQEKLQAYIDDQQTKGVKQGNANRSRGALADLLVEGDLQQGVARWIREGRLEKVLELWVEGLPLDWQRFYERHKPGKVRLPVYPFAKERYWAVSSETPKPALSRRPGSAPLGSIEEVLAKIETGLLNERQGADLVRAFVH